MSTEDKTVVESTDDTATEDLEVNDTSDESAGEGEVEETAKSEKQSSTETPEQRRARIKRQYEREFGKQGKENTEEGTKEGSEKEVGDDRYTRLELKTEGITSKKAQDVVLEYAKFKGIEALEALKSPIVRAEIAELEKKTSVPPPSKRTSTGATDSFEYWASQARKGNFPRHDKEMMAKLKKARIFTS